MMRMMRLTHLILYIDDDNDAAITEVLEKLDSVSDFNSFTLMMNQAYRDMLIEQGSYEMNYESSPRNYESSPRNYESSPRNYESSPMKYESNDMKHESDYERSVHSKL